LETIGINVGVLYTSAVATGLFTQPLITNNKIPTNKAFVLPAIQASNKMM
jgi:hypothetical protein